jgi:hypothetical protein
MVVRCAARADDLQWFQPTAGLFCYCQGNRLVTASEDNMCRAFDIAKKENTFEALLARFAAPVRACALNASGSVCAAGGE